MLRLLCIIFLGTSLNLYAQDDLAGSWDGALDLPGLKLEMAIVLAQEDGAWSGTLDIPVQNIDDMALADLAVTNQSLSFKLPEVPGNASYQGTLNDQGDLAGTFSQGGQQLELIFSRTDARKEAAILSRLHALPGVIDSLMQKHQVPGMALAIVRDDKVVVNTGLGHADVDQRRKVTTNTLFAIGSTTKAITAAGLAILADRDQLEWDQPLKTYLPDFEMYDDFASKEMTALDLTTHRSGLPRHDLLWYGTELSREQMFQRLRHLEPSESFRTTWQYQNLMYMTAGILIERLTDQSWEDFTKAEILAPLAMNRTNLSIDDSAADSDAALGYRINDEEEFVVMDYRNIDEVGPAGSINSTSTDMAQWVRLNLKKGTLDNQELISDKQFDFMHSPHMIVSTRTSDPEFTPAQYGTGWFITDYRGSKVVQHGGNIDGFSALVCLFPEEKTGLVVLVNKNGAAIPGVVSRLVADIVLENPDPIDWATRAYGEDEDEEEEGDAGEEEELGRVSGTQPSHALADYVGTYEHKAYPPLVIRAEGDELRTKTNGFDIVLDHWHYDVFQARDTSVDFEIKMQFHYDVMGTIHQLGIAMEPSLDPIMFVKKPPAQLDDANYRSRVAGLYKLEDFEVRILDEGGKLILSPQGQPKFQLEPYQEDHFKAKDLKGYSIEFVFDGSQVRHLLLHQPNGTFKAEPQRE